jgi:UDP-glucuronate 4-epimerase
MYLVTGVAGFIGNYVALHLLERGERVIGVDSINDYYETSLKHARLARILSHPNFLFYHEDIADRKFTESLRAKHPDIRYIIHLAAQAGVRYSLENPHAYTHANVEGQLCMLELARNLKQCDHFVYASSSSVYGLNSKMPFSTKDVTDTPVSLYAATKKSCELLTHAYSHLYNFPSTGLRFFTVYGPWGRPDMSAFLFTRAILEGKPIRLFNYGDMSRDFTYIDDIVRGILLVTERPPLDLTPKYRVYNIGNNKPERLEKFVQVLEQAIGKKAIVQREPMQAGDVKDTFADIDPITHDAGFSPTTPIEVGLHNFVSWYRGYYKI